MNRETIVNLANDTLASVRRDPEFLRLSALIDTSRDIPLVLEPGDAHDDAIAAAVSRFHDLISAAYDRIGDRHGADVAEAVTAEINLCIAARRA